MFALVLFVRACEGVFVRSTWSGASWGCLFAGFLLPGPGKPRPTRADVLVWPLITSQESSWAWACGEWDRALLSHAKLSHLHKNVGFSPDAGWGKAVKDLGPLPGFPLRQTRSISTSLSKLLVLVHRIGLHDSEPFWRSEGQSPLSFRSEICAFPRSVWRWGMDLFVFVLWFRLVNWSIWMNFQNVTI